MAHLYAPDSIGSISDDYKEQMQKEHAVSKWGMSGRKYAGDAILKIVNGRHKPITILDYGCGKGVLGEYIVKNCSRELSWTNYDPGMPEYDTLPKGTFDLVITTDVLEHIEEESLPIVLKQLAERTGKLLYNDIACYLTGSIFMEGPYKGRDMHLTVEPPTWWREQLRVMELYEHSFEYTVNEMMKKGAPRIKTRCTLIHERL